ncbi:MAG: DUF1801 domain-containing protein [Tannerellaceae bacterium]|nr:DUF1801 domain-containing protein [Tannerellaceae bacterium]
MMREALYDFYLQCEEPQQSTLLALRNIILEHDQHISETMKYGMPCFLYRKNIFCYLWMDQKTKEPYMLMAEGNRLNHPALEKGNRARMKILRTDPYADLPFSTIKAILQEGINLYINGIVKLK